jgi:hypothetical protein
MRGPEAYQTARGSSLREIKSRKTRKVMGLEESELPRDGGEVERLRRRSGGKVFFSTG